MNEGYVTVTQQREFMPSDDADYVRPESSPPKLDEIEGEWWSQQTASGENALWYSRFCHYLRLGPTRSVSLAATGRRNAYPLPSHWMVTARDFRWKDRAKKYDEAKRAAAVPGRGMAPILSLPVETARRTVRAKPRPEPVPVVARRRGGVIVQMKENKPVDDVLPTEEEINDDPTREELDAEEQRAINESGELVEIVETTTEALD